MSDKKFALYLWQVSRIVLTPLLIVSIALFYKVSALTPDAALHTYHSYPYMSEHILVGLVLYLAFSLLITKIHLTSLHDRR